MPVLYSSRSRYDWPLAVNRQRGPQSEQNSERANWPVAGLWGGPRTPRTVWGPARFASALRLVLFLDDLGVAHGRLEAVEAVDPLGDEPEVQVLGHADVHLLAVDDEGAGLDAVPQCGV